MSSAIPWASISTLGLWDTLNTSIIASKSSGIYVPALKPAQATNTPSLSSPGPMENPTERRCAERPNVKHVGQKAGTRPALPTSRLPGQQLSAGASSASCHSRSPLFFAMGKDDIVFTKIYGSLWYCFRSSDILATLGNHKPKESNL